jgi:hypothetical protein
MPWWDAIFFDGVSPGREYRTDLHQSVFEIQSIGDDALNFLSTSPSGTVMASVTRASYLLSDRGDLFWLTETPGPMHSRSMQSSSSVPRLTVGSRYRVRDHFLDTDSGITINYQHSMIWQPPPVPTRKVAALNGLPELAAPVYEHLVVRHEPAGWGRWIPAILTGIPFRDNLPLSFPPPAAGEILLACKRHDPDSISKYAIELVGLGEGLTPSGDDFLGGLFFCFQFLRTLYPEKLDSSWNYSNLVQQYKPRTNLISFTFLSDNARGYAVEPLHRFAINLFSCETEDRILPFAEELILVGHSTGWDLLTGFLVGMHVLFPQ